MAAESREGKRATRGKPGGSGGDDRPDGGSGADGPCDGYTDGELYRGQQQGWGEGRNFSGNEARTDHAAAVASAGRTGSGSALSWTVGVLEWVETAGCL
jgi:hypothetical protein